MTDGITQLLQSLQLQTLEDNAQLARYSGRASDDSGNRIYGGQVLAQALAAMQDTAEQALIAHSMHAYFLRPGDPHTDVEYRVDKLRDGRSFSTRSVTASQHGKVIFSATGSFQRPEQGLEHSIEMPAAAAPEQLVNEERRIDALFEKRGISNDYSWPIDIRYVDPPDLERPGPRPARELVWVKATGVLPSSQAVHQQVLAYASDNPILVPAFNPHGLGPLAEDVIATTISHSLWLHRPARADEWLLFDVNSDTTMSGRGMGQARIFSRDDQLVASAVQEGLVRLRNA